MWKNFGRDQVQVVEILEVHDLHVLALRTDGGELVQADALKSGKPEVIVENARKFVAIVNATRSRLTPAVASAR